MTLIESCVKTARWGEIERLRAIREQQMPN